MNIKTQGNGWKIQACLSCGLVQVMPQPSLQEISLLYKNDWLHFAPYRSQEEAHRKYFENLLSFILPFSDGSQKKLLDIGCATGVLLSVCKKKGILGTGVDMSTDAVRFCRKNGYEAYVGSLQTIAPKKQWEKRFGIVVASQVIEHERDPKKLFHTIQTVLEKDGICVFTTPNFDTPWRKWMGDRWIGYQHPEHLFFFSKNTLKQSLEKAGFHILCICGDIPRSYSLSYAFRRLADYLPKGKKFFQFLMYVTRDINITMPFNPWGDMLFIAKKIKPACPPQRVNRQTRLPRRSRTAG